MDVESELASYDVESIARNYVERMKGGPADHAVAIVMDEDFLTNDDAVSSLLSVRDDTDTFSLVYLIDPLRDDAQELVERVAETGAIGVKFHPYMQSLTRDKFPEVKKVGKVIDEKDLLTIVDCSYGSELLYETNGVELGHELGRNIDSPVLLAHGGGPRILDAFSSVDAIPNVYTDTSFSLSFWDGSTLIQDYGFAASKLGGEQVLWGTDDPVVDQKQSFERAKIFAENYIEDEKNYFGGTAEELIDEI
jgi:predicted TIM-barrel fold metal-dependent hydrolase